MACKRRRMSTTSLSHTIRNKQPTKFPWVPSRACMKFPCFFTYREATGRDSLALQYCFHFTATTGNETFFCCRGGGEERKRHHNQTNTARDIIRSTHVALSFIPPPPCGFTPSYFPKTKHNAHIYKREPTKIDERPIAKHRETTRTKMDHGMTEKNKERRRSVQSCV